MCPTDLRSSWSSVSDAEELNLHYLIQKSKVYRRRTVYVFLSDMVHNFGKTKWGHAGLEDVTWPFVKKFENMAKTTPNIFCPKKQQRLLCLIEPLVLSFFSWAINCEIITSLLLNLIEIESPGVFFNCILDLMNNLCAIFWLGLYNFDMGL